MARILWWQRRRRRAAAAVVAGLGLLTVALVLPWSGDGVSVGKGPAVGNALGGGPDMECGPLFENPVAGAYYFVCRPRPAAGGEGSRAPDTRPERGTGGRLWLAATRTTPGAA